MLEEQLLLLSMGMASRLKILINKIHVPSSTDSNIDIAKLQSSLDKESLQGISEKSKPLSPNSSQQLSPKEGEVFDYVPKTNTTEKNNSKNKNNVKFKEDEEYGEDEGSVLPAEELKVNQNPSQEANSNTKLTSILKNSNLDKNSEINNESSVKLSPNLNNTSEKNEVMDAKIKGTEILTKQKGKKAKKNTIPNMKIEEDKVNLSDLGNGPEKPTIKTIYKKIIVKKESTPGKISSKINKSPKIQKNKISTKDSLEGNNEEGGYESNQDSDNIDLLENSEILDYTPISSFIVYSDLSQEKNFKIKQYKDAIYRG